MSFLTHSHEISYRIRFVVLTPFWCGAVAHLVGLRRWFISAPPLILHGTGMVLRVLVSDFGRELVFWVLAQVAAWAC
jgi:hypothetical protein